MSVDIGQAIEEGGKRTIAGNGLYFVAILWVLGILNEISLNAVYRWLSQQLPGTPGRIPGGAAPPGLPTGDAIGPSLGLPPGIAAVFLLFFWAVVIVVIGAALRTFVSEDTETLPAERFTRKLGWMWINLFVGEIVFWFVVTVGLLFLVLPGLFLLVALFFWGVYVAVEDRNFVEGLSNSWTLTEGDRLMLFVLGVVVVIISIVVSVVFGLASFAGGWIELILTQLGSAVVLVFILATTARTFLQLEAEEPTPAG